MSKVLTEVDVFTTQVIVPEGADSRDDAAGDVELLSQSLANRTHHLNLHAAKKDTTNTFTANQTITGDLGVSGAVNASDVNVSDDFTVAGDAAIPVIVGSVAIAADLSVGDDLTVTGDATIPNVAGNVAISGDVTCGDLDSGGDIFAADDLIAGGDFQYSPAKSRTVYLPLFASLGEATISAAGGVNHLVFGGGGDVQTWPIRLPAGATITDVTVLVAKASTGLMTLALMQKDDTPNPPTETAVASDSDTSSGLQFLAASGSFSVDPTDTEYYVHLTSGDAADSVYKVRLQYTDPGPGPS